MGVPDHFTCILRNLKLVKKQVRTWHEIAAAAAAKLLQSCPTLWDPRLQPTRLPHPWDSPGKNTGVGCHFLIQCMKVKSESEVAQSCLTLSDLMDCSPPGSSVHGIFQARVLEWGAIAFWSMFKWTGSKLGKEYNKALHCHPAYLTYMQSTSCERLG